MWEEGNLIIKGEIVNFSAKVYEVGSEFGIDGGKISKLMIKVNGRMTVHYDRGWDIELNENDKISKEAYEQIIKKYN